MANTLLTTQEITRETLMILKNNLKIVPNIYTDYDTRFGRAGAKIGDTLYVRKPQRYIGRDGQAFVPEALTDTQTPVVINMQSGVDFQFASAEKFLSLDDFSRRYLRPAAIALANKIDRICAQQMYLNTFNAVGSPGTVPNTLLTYLQAGQKLDEMGAPMDDERCVVITPAARVSIVDALKGLFQEATQIGKQYRTGQMGTAAGFDWYQDQNIFTHTVGPLGGTPVVNGAGQMAEGGNNATMSLATSGWTAAAANRLKAGDIFTIANVFAVNPQNRQSTGALQQFVVLQDFNSDGSGAGNILIAPAITPTGQYQNVDSSPAASAAITVLGAASTVTPQLLAFHKMAFTMVSVPLDVPDGVDMGYVETDKETGISLRFIRQYVATTDQWVNRFDILYGVSKLYAELCCRIAS